MTLNYLQNKRLTYNLTMQEYLNDNVSHREYAGCYMRQIGNKRHLFILTRQTATYTLKAETVNSLQVEILGYKNARLCERAVASLMQEVLRHIREFERF